MMVQDSAVPTTNDEVKLMFTETWSDGEPGAEAPTDWIWTGLLAPGQITLMTGLWKTGKTTLFAHLLACRHAATPLLDRAVRPGLTAVVTEEPAALWRARCRKLGIGPNVCFFHRPFMARPTTAEFAALIAHLLDLKARRNIDLMVLDPLAHFLPIRCENSAEAMQAALQPLRRLTDRGLATLLCHHPSKEHRKPGQAARGSGALPAFADILLELHPFAAGVPGDRRRLLYGFSRWEETPPSLLIELNAEGSGYRILPEERCTDFPDYWPLLELVLTEAPAPLTRAQIRDRWGDDPPRPPMRTLWAWLNAACAESLVARSGTGRANDPFKYCLPHRMPAWLADPFWCRLNGGAPPDAGDTTDMDVIAPQVDRLQPVESLRAEPPEAGPQEAPGPVPVAEPDPGPPSHMESIRRWLASLQGSG
jgi:hypothetical protein